MFNLTNSSSYVAALLGAVYLLAVAPRLAVIDWRERRLPNRLVLPGFAFAAAGQAIAVVLEPAAIDRTIAAIVVAGIGFAAALFANLRLGLGMGDVKLFGLIAFNLAWFSPLLVPLVWAVASVTGVVEVVGKAIKRKTMRLSGTIALGPHLLLGFAMAGVVALAVMPGLVWPG